jgi:hypothetical protein
MLCSGDSESDLFQLAISAARPVDSDRFQQFDSDFSNLVTVLRLLTGNLKMACLSPSQLSAGTGESTAATVNVQATVARTSQVTNIMPTVPQSLHRAQAGSRLRARAESSPGRLLGVQNPDQFRRTWTRIWKGRSLEDPGCTAPLRQPEAR